MAKINFYPSPETMKIINVGKYAPDGFSERANFFIHSAHVLMKDSKPSLTEMEWLSLMQMFMGTHWDYSQGPKHLITCFIMDIEDSKEEMSVNHVDNMVLAEKIKNMPFANQLAIFEICRNYIVDLRIASDRTATMKQLIEVLGGVVVD